MTFATINNELDKYEIDDKNMTLEKLSKVVVDSDNINSLFNELLFDQVLRNSSFSNRILINNEIQLFNDNGDSILLFFDKNKQIYEMMFKSYDNPIELSLKKENDSVSIIKTVIYPDGEEYITKSVFNKEDDSYIQKRLMKKYIEKKDDLETCYKSIYDLNKDKLTLFESIVVKDDEKALSTTSMLRTIEPSDYVKENGLFHIIRPFKYKNDIISMVSTSRKLVKEMTK